MLIQLSHSSTQTACSLCDQAIAFGVQLFNDGLPICLECVSLSDPDLSAALYTFLGPSAAIFAKQHPHNCTDCGQPTAAGPIGHIDRQPYCRRCFAERSPYLAALLIVGDALKQENLGPEATMEVAHHFRRIQWNRPQ